MTAIKEVPFKELTVKQYEFYKRKGLSDERIMKLHGYNVNTLNAWKKTNDLIGVKFEKDVKVTSASSSSVESEPEVVKVEKVFNPEINEVESKMIHNSQNKPQKVTAERLISEAKQLPSEEVESFIDANTSDLYDLPPIGSLSVGDKPEAPVSTDWLNERHCRDTETIYKLRSDIKGAEKERYAEIERGDTWRTKYIAADRELTKAQVKHDAEVRNLKYEIELLNKALEEHAGDEQLLLLTMKKAVSFAERVAGE